MSSRKRTASTSASPTKKSRTRSSGSSTLDVDEVEDGIKVVVGDGLKVEIGDGLKVEIGDELKVEAGDGIKVEVEPRVLHPQRISKDPTGLLALKSVFFARIASLEDLPIPMDEEIDVFSSDVMEGFRALFNKLDDDEPTENRIVIDQFLRDYLLERIMGQRVPWGLLLELSIRLAREEIASASIPIALVTDLIELSSLEACEEIFQFVEIHLDTWREAFFINSGKNAVLRMCNDLLRRLSRASNTIFCGRILIFLSNYFPFSERSGLNIMSEFNTDNLTIYKSGDGSDDPEDRMEVAVEADEVLFQGMDLKIPGLEEMISMCQEEKKKGMKVDYNIYVKFWSLQDFFRNPLQCYNKIAWKTFTSYSGDVLTAFQCFKIENIPVKRRMIEEVSELEDTYTAPSSSINIIPRRKDDDLYFAKNLTNRRLLELQMGDPTFRRNFMVQLLIVLQYLTLAVKFKGESNTLSDEQQEYIRKTTDHVYELLTEVPPDGKEFVESVKHILKREEFWNKWKNDGCPIFKRPAVAQPISTDLKDDREDRLDGDDEKEKEKAATKESSTPVKSTLNPDARRTARSGDTVALETATDDISPEFEDTPKPKPKKKRRHLGDIIKEASANNKFLLGNSELTRLWNICPDNLEACRAKARDFMPPIETYFAEAMKELDPEGTPLPDPKKGLKQKKILGNASFGWRALRLLARRSPYFFQVVSGSPIHPLQNYLEYTLRKIAVDLEVPLIVSADGINNGHSLHTSLTGNTCAHVDAEGEEMDAGADDDEELIKPEIKREDDVREEEEGEVNEKLRPLTSEECTALGKSLGADWKKVASKLGFTADEIDYFEAERKDKAAEYMLSRWTENEGDDATVADLLYTLEGLGLHSKAETILS